MTPEGLCREYAVDLEASRAERDEARQLLREVLALQMVGPQSVEDIDGRGLVVGLPVEWIDRAQHAVDGSET